MMTPAMSPAIQELAFLAKEWQVANRADAFGMGAGSMTTYTAALAAKQRFLAAHAKLRPAELADALVLLAGLVAHSVQEAEALGASVASVP
jgi:hypothetical protein